VNLLELIQLQAAIQHRAADAQQGACHPLVDLASSRALAISTSSAF